MPRNKFPVDKVRKLNLAICKDLLHKPLKFCQLNKKTNRIIRNNLNNIFQVNFWFELFYSILCRFEMVRLKHRYLVGQVISESDDIVSRDLLMAIREKIQTLWGDIGSGGFGNSISIKFYDDSSRLFVVRVPRDFEMDLRLTILCVDQIKKKNVCVRLIQVVGCVRSCRDTLSQCFTTVLQFSPASEKSASFSRFKDLIENAEL